MRDLWFAEYEKVFDEWDGNATEEQIIALTERRYRERMAERVDLEVPTISIVGD